MITEKLKKAADPWDKTGTWPCSAWHLRNNMACGGASVQKDKREAVLTPY